jgi:hypothetical protein
MHQQWNGAFHRAHAQRASLVYVYPKEGIRLFIDNLAIPKDATNVKEAHAFLNWMMQPENIAAASNFAKYNNAITGSEKFMEKELFDDPAINTPTDKLDRLKPSALLAEVPGAARQGLDQAEEVSQRCAGGAPAPQSSARTDRLSIRLSERSPGCARRAAADATGRTPPWAAQASGGARPCQSPGPGPGPARSTPKTGARTAPEEYRRC